MTRQMDHVLAQANTVKNYIEDHAEDMPRWKSAIFEKRLGELEDLTTCTDRRLVGRV